jgi:hypothetical protein
MKINHSRNVFRLGLATLVACGSIFLIRSTVRADVDGATRPPRIAARSSSVRTMRWREGMKEKRLPCRQALT